MIPDSIVDDTAQYTVKATNEFGTIECTVTVQVEYQGPKITKPLEDTTVTITETVTLECKFTGIPNPTPTWNISGATVEETDKYHIETKEDTSTLEIRSVTVDDTEMTYTCKVTNPFGEDSTTARLLPQGLWAFIVSMFLVERFLLCMPDIFSTLLTSCPVC